MGINIFAPWCMHLWASIITNASIHMHHSIVHGTFYHRVAPAKEACLSLFLGMVALYWHKEACFV